MLPTSTSKMRRRSTPAALLLATLGLWSVGCSGSDGDGGPGDFVCGVETDGFERCTDGVVEWCHALGDPHFHGGRDCARDGQSCVVGPDRLGYCAADDATCEAASTPGECVDNAAYNCVEGLRGERRCGVGKTCAVEDGWAQCVEL